MKALALFLVQVSLWGFVLGLYCMTVATGDWSWLAASIVPAAAALLDVFDNVTDGGKRPL